MLELRLHPLVRPPKQDALQDAIDQDVAANGQRVPLLCIKGDNNGDFLIIDGARRFIACLKAGIKTPRFEKWTGDPAKLPEEIASRKMLREHMSASQLAAVAVRHEAAFGIGALDRQKAGCKVKVNLAANLQQGPGRTLAKSAQFFGAKPRLCYDLKEILKRDPTLFDLVESGELNGNEAREKLRDRDHATEAAANRRKITKVRRRPIDENLTLIKGNSLNELMRKNLPQATAIIADGPYNNGTEYDGDSQGDRLSDDDFLEMSYRWMCLCASKLTNDGSLFVLIDDRYDEPFGMLLRKTGLHRQNKIVWWKHFPVNQAGNYSKAAVYLHCYSKHPKKFIWHPPFVESVRNAIGDVRGKTAGKVPDNIWPIHMVPGNANERANFEDTPPQVPLELLMRLILASTEPDDLVLDPFNGNGTSPAAAILCGRRAIGIDRSAKYLAQSKLWISQTITDGVPPRLQHLFGATR